MSSFKNIARRWRRWQSDNLSHSRAGSIIVDEIKKRAEHKSHSFAHRYPLVVANYFGGLYSHLQSLAEILPSGAKCAYLLGEQKSYLGIFIPTPEIFSELACQRSKAFKEAKRIPIRIRKGTNGNRGEIKEEAVIIVKR